MVEGIRKAGMATCEGVQDVSRRGKAEGKQKRVVGSRRTVVWGPTGVVPVGAIDDATLFGGLGRDGKNDSLEPFGKTVPFVGNVGDPVSKRKNWI